MINNSVDVERLFNHSPTLIFTFVVIIGMYTSMAILGFKILETRFTLQGDSLCMK